jgi:hypothetical protein
MISQKQVKKALQLLNENYPDKCSSYHAATLLTKKLHGESYGTALSMIHYLERTGFLEKMVHNDVAYYIITRKGRSLINEAEVKKDTKSEEAVKVENDIVEIRKSRIKQFIEKNPWSYKWDVQKFLEVNKDKISLDVTYNTLREMVEAKELIMMKNGVKNIYALPNTAQKQSRSVDELQKLKKEQVKEDYLKSQEKYGDEITTIPQTAARGPEKPLPAEMQIYGQLRPYVSDVKISIEEDNVRLKTTFDDPHETIKAYNQLPEKVRESSLPFIDTARRVYYLLFEVPLEAT